MGHDYRRDVSRRRKNDKFGTGLHFLRDLLVVVVGISQDPLGGPSVLHLPDEGAEGERI